MLEILTCSFKKVVTCSKSKMSIFYKFKLDEKTYCWLGVWLFDVEYQFYAKVMLSHVSCCISISFVHELLFMIYYHLL